MTKPFKFRYVNQIVGGFVLLVVGALLAGVILAGLAQQWFEPKFELLVKFPPEGSAGIKKGAEVVILGTLVGAVDRVTVNDDGSMEGTLIIQNDFTRFVREDSKAVLKKKYGVAGDAFVEITKGTGPVLKENVLPLPAEKDAELIEAVQQTLEQVRKAVMPILEQVQKAVEEYAGLAADLRKPDGNMQKILANVEALTAGLEKGEGSAGKILKDPATAEQVQAAVTNLNLVLDGVNQTVLSLNGRLRQVEGILDDVKSTSAHLPEALLQTQDTLREAEVLIEGVQRHWLMRKYVEETAPSERITPMDLTPGKEVSP